MHCPCAFRSIALAILVVAGQTAWAGKDCDAPPEAWQSVSAVHALAERNGWHVERLKIDDGCYEIKGRDADGHRLKAKIDPASLKVISVKREHGEHDRQLQREAPPSSPTASAPAGLLSPGPDAQARLILFRSLQSSSGVHE